MIIFIAWIQWMNFIYVHPLLIHKMNTIYESTLSPLKNCSHKYNFLQLSFLATYEHHILDYFFFLKVYMISLKLNLMNYLKKSNKHSRTWIYWQYLQQNNT
jgi:hypothetical protein